MDLRASDVPVFVLCGGLGTRLKEETELRPKPMIEIGNRPILWHIMRKYSQHGFRRFVLCAGYKAAVIKSYFLNYAALQTDFTVHLGSGIAQGTHVPSQTTFHSDNHVLDWEVTVAQTGELTMTGARVFKAASQYLGNAEHFAVTYGDGLTDADLLDEYRLHVREGRIATVLGINPPSRFGELRAEGNKVQEFAEKPRFTNRWVNGGYFFFHRKVLSYLNANEDCVLEQEPLVRLVKDGQLTIYKHEKFWACMDTQRDKEQLEQIWASGNVPWAR